MTQTDTTPAEPGSTASELRDAVAALARRVRILEAQQAVRTLQHSYGYYLDKCLYQEVVDLFTADGQVSFFGGRYVGRDSVRRLYVDRFRQRFTGGLNGPRFGFLLDHPQHQDVVTVADDGASARGRFRSMMQAGLHDAAKATFPGQVSMDQWWEGGIYENEYAIEDGVWKIRSLNYRPVWHAEYTEGWAHKQPMPFFTSTCFPDDPLGPDELIEGYELFPNTEVFAFHYPHPVTGATVVSEDDDAARHA